MKYTIKLLFLPKYFEANGAATVGSLDFKVANSESTLMSFSAYKTPTADFHVVTALDRFHLGPTGAC